LSSTRREVYLWFLLNQVKSDCTGPARLVPTFQTLININETMHFNSDGTTGFLGHFFFQKCCPTSCQFSKVADFQARWIGLGRSWILWVYPVFLDPVRTGTGSFHRIVKCNRKARRVDVMDSVFRYVWTQYTCCAPVLFILPESRTVLQKLLKKKT